MLKFVLILRCVMFGIWLCKFLKVVFMVVCVMLCLWLVVLVIFYIMMCWIMWYVLCDLVWSCSWVCRMVCLCVSCWVWCWVYVGFSWWLVLNVCWILYWSWDSGCCCGICVWLVFCSCVFWLWNVDGWGVMDGGWVYWVLCWWGCCVELDMVWWGLSGMYSGCWCCCVVGCVCDVWLICCC